MAELNIISTNKINVCMVMSTDNYLLSLTCHPSQTIDTAQDF